MQFKVLVQNKSTKRNRRSQNVTLQSVQILVQYKVNVHINKIFVTCTKNKKLKLYWYQVPGQNKRQLPQRYVQPVNLSQN